MEQLQKVYQGLGELEIAGDADLMWIAKTLRGPVLAKLREPVDRMQASQMSAVGPGPQMNGPLGMGGPPPGMGPAGPTPSMRPPGDPQGMPGGLPGPPGGPGIGGLRNSATPPIAVDELRRVLGRR